MWDWQAIIVYLLVGCAAAYLAWRSWSLLTKQKCNHSCNCSSKSPPQAANEPLDLISLDSLMKRWPHAAN